MSEEEVEQLCKAIQEGKMEDIEKLSVIPGMKQSLGIKEWTVGTTWSDGCCMHHRENLDSLTISYDSPLHLATSLGLVDVIKLLHKTGANVNSICNYAQGSVTALHYAVRCKQGLAAKTLLDLGAEINIEGRWTLGRGGSFAGSALDFATKMPRSEAMPEAIREDVIERRW